MAVEALHIQGLVTTVDGAAHLVGARCDTCGSHTFPAQASCARCGGSMAAVALPSQGQVWSWTVQRQPPKPPYRGATPFEPFAVAYVDLGPLRVEACLQGRSVDRWHIGDAVELRAGPPDGDGAVWSFCFVPQETN